jgi:hypothetical protein
MAVTHLQRIAAHLNLHRSAVTSTCMRLRHLLLDMAQMRQDLQDSIPDQPKHWSRVAILRLVMSILRKFALIPSFDRARSSPEVL